MTLTLSQIILPECAIADTMVGVCQRSNSDPIAFLHLDKAQWHYSIGLQLTVTPRRFQS